MTAVLDRQLHFVSGKGGVGKSVTACALASRFCQDKKKTLLVQINAADSHAPMLGIDPVPERILKVDEFLSVVNVSPTQSLREYALLTLKFEAVYKAAFENRLMKNFLRFIPSLPELTMLGKIWFHAEQEGRFERIVVDCPSTGHGLGFLRVAQVIRDVIRVGKIADEAGMMAATLADKNRTAVHIVSLPEEMPSTEAIELVRKLKPEFPLGFMILNQWLEPLFEEQDEEAFALHRENSVAEFAPFDRAGERRQIRDRLSLDQRRRLSGAVDLELIQFPLITRATLHRKDIRELAGCFL